MTSFVLTDYVVWLAENWIMHECIIAHEYHCVVNGGRLCLIMCACLLRLTYRLKVSHMNLMWLYAPRPGSLKVEHWGLVAEAARIFRREVLSDDDVKSCRNNVGKYQKSCSRVYYARSSWFIYFHCTGIEGCKLNSVVYCQRKCDIIAESFPWA